MINNRFVYYLFCTVLIYIAYIEYYNKLLFSINIMFVKFNRISVKKKKNMAKLNKFNKNIVFLTNLKNVDTIL